MGTPTPSAPPITSEHIRIAFDGPLPFDFSQYYRGGPRVPNTPDNAGIPTSGPHDFFQYLNKSNFAAVRTGPASIDDLAVAQDNDCQGGTSFSASGGVGGYTYNSVWASGGANMTITNSTSANPVVISSHTAPRPLERTGIMRTTVTSGSKSQSFDTPVTFNWEI